MSFVDRAEAGQRLGARLGHLRGQNVVVLGLPRGGVPVAFAVAQAIDAPLDVIVVQLLATQDQPELVLGVLGEHAVVPDDRVLEATGTTSAELAAMVVRERANLEHRVLQYRAEQPRVPLAGRIAVIVDEGAASASLAKGACQVARANGAERVVLAVPWVSSEAVDALGEVADELVYLETSDVAAGGRQYRDLPPISDDEVVAFLVRAEIHQGPRLLSE
jgi:putative phosphoribosyl transferase